MFQEFDLAWVKRNPASALSMINRLMTECDEAQALAKAAAVGYAAVLEWRSPDTAPFNVPVHVKVGEGMVLIARLIPDAAMTSMEESCDQWQAEHEGEHPECWHGGACWEINEDECASLQVSGWRPLPPPPTTEGSKGE